MLYVACVEMTCAGVDLLFSEGLRPVDFVWNVWFARLLKRLDGAMQMLEALGEMCGQQRKVIAAQQTAISALKDSFHGLIIPSNGA